MAFQAPIGFQNVASATTELWPLMHSALLTPWQAGSRHTPVPSTAANRRHMNGTRSPSSDGFQTGSATSAATSPKQLSSSAQALRATKPVLPECLNNAPLAALRAQSSPAIFGGKHDVGNRFAFNQSTLQKANPLAWRLTNNIRNVRPYSSISAFGLNKPMMRPFPWSIPHQRSFSAGSSSRNLLAHMEQTANNNPQSATAQNAFYTALLRANMADIIVERYQTGRYATNPACETTYLRALEKVGQSEKAAAIISNKGADGSSGALSTDQLQAIGHAVAAQSRGGNIALARNRGAQGTGAKESPLYVVVEESIGGTIFKWAKFLLYFALVAYFSLVLATVVIETTGILKKVGGSQTNEARPEHQNVRFSDVHGCDEAKEELQELVEFLKAPEKFSSLGGKLPKGVLLVGPPGTGKTLLARAVAGEAGVPFFFMSGSEFDEVYVGVGAKRVRELFNAARAKAPAIVFIDELDAIGGKRNERDAAYVKQTLNQLLTDLDGFEQNSGVIFLAATNFPQLLDKALTRPGRFDRNVVVPLPDVRGRVEILKHHMKNIQIGTDVDAAVIARGTPGFSGAELENVVNQAAVHASRNKAKKVGMMDFEWAKDKILMGAERRSAVIQQKDKVMTAYHEGGHALVAMFTAGADPLYKATIMPRGQALGITFQLPELDKVSMVKREYLAHIDICMGGKVAEELVYGPENVTSGAASDIQKATQIAYAMVTQMGMSDLIGNVDLNTDYARLSSETKQTIEREVRRLVEEGRDRATRLLTSKRKELDILANALVEYESLNKEEMEKVLRGEKLPDRVTSLPNVPLKLPESLMPPGLKGAGGEGAPPPPGRGDDGGATL
ncbi:cell division protease ftsH [Xylona heveae TC161]|uniref:Cell division protease ftsH n=1 Tax=Xylona heveae (strain CBS 132557 / TC161) TaxID=1328760 RepID=A0A165IFN4_XYLHT|nr:cell division protease ftsH [Xylona heveae TC161]KZF24828.1 cell division protease ftsH [Xylona heveae TC161]